MKRPMLVTGFTCLFISVILSRVSMPVSVVIAAASLVFFVISVCIKKTRQALTIPTATLSAVFACILFLGYTAAFYTPAVKCCAGKTTVTGHILSVPVSKSSSGTYAYVIKTDTVGGKRLHKKMRLTLYSELNADIYDNVSFDGNVYTMGEDDGETGLYYKSLRMYLGAFASDEVEVTQPEGHTPYYYVLLLKQKISNRIWGALPGDNGGFLIAMLFGDKSYISNELVENMRTAGLSHLTAVSGLHLSAWTMLFISILEKLKLNKRLTAILGIIPVLGVMTFSAFSVSVMRAGTMLLLYLAGRFFSQNTDGLNSVGFACFILILFNPYTVCDVSFLLSVSATTGVIICSRGCLSDVDRVARGIVPKIGFILSKAASVAAISLFAQLFTFPVSAYYFGKFSPYGVLANIFVSFPSVMGMYLSVPLTLLSSAAFVGGAMKTALGLLTRYIIKVTEIISSLPGSSVRADYIYVYAAFGVAVFIFAVMYAVSDKKLKSTVAALLTGVTVLCTGAAVYKAVDRSQIRFITVDTGSLCVMLQRQGKADVIGCGGEYYTASRINDEADRVNVTIENLILPSAESYTSSAVKRLAITNPEISIVSSENVTTGLNYVKQTNIKLKPSEGLRIYSYNGYVLCTVYGTSLVIGDSLPHIKADILITYKADGDTENFKNVIEQSKGNYVVTVKKDGFSIKQKGNRNGSS